MSDGTRIEDTSEPIKSSGPPRRNEVHAARSRYRNYRLFFFGQGVSLIGSWLTTTATSWLVYRLAQGQSAGKGGNGAGRGAVRRQIPTFLIAPLAGVLVDRWDRHRVIVVTQILSLVQSGLLAVLTLIAQGHDPQVVVAELSSRVSSTRSTLRAAGVRGRDGRAARGSVQRHRLEQLDVQRRSPAGPRGRRVDHRGDERRVCFLIDAISYFAVIVALLMMDVNRGGKPVRAQASTARAA